jgi:hypothetical protein
MEESDMASASSLLRDEATNEELRLCAKTRTNYLPPTGLADGEDPIAHLVGVLGEDQYGLLWGSDLEAELLVLETI